MNRPDWLAGFVVAVALSGLILLALVLQGAG